MNILVTGAAGYIGSHTVLELLKSGYQIIAMDNLSNSKFESLKRVEKLTGKSINFIKADLRNIAELDNIFKENKIDSVIHFAGLKAVGESCEKPLEYYENNISGTLNLLFTMRKYGVKNIVFSSSSTVYGDPERIPLTEDCNTGRGVTNPYGRTKYMLEEILKDFYEADKSFNIALLRYFNPIGADESGQIGEDPNGIPNNLLPYIAQVAIGKREKLSVFGDDYDTKDGTGVRDYIHVSDLALGHLKAIEKLAQNPGLVIYNLGTGIGYSVLEIVAAFEKASGVKVPYVITSRRAGDIATNYADASKAYQELGWKATRDLNKMCLDSWNFQKANPDGYGEG